MLRVSASRALLPRVHIREMENIRRIRYLPAVIYSYRFLRQGYLDFGMPKIDLSISKFTLSFVYSFIRCLFMFSFGLFHCVGVGYIHLVRCPLPRLLFFFCAGSGFSCAHLPNGSFYLYIYIFFGRWFLVFLLNGDILVYPSVFCFNMHKKSIDQQIK